ncbi:MAG: DUF499 domain-containing protein [Chloroflexi bacterium]|nr:DUF499 domain-containing protein [Chloroflexota bacterium]
MTTINRPNRDALNQAIDILRDSMRPFLMRCLKSIRGSTPEEAIRRSLPPSQAIQFAQTLKDISYDVQAAIDIAHFPHLVGKNWEAFRRRFNNDRTVGNELWLIVSARNQVAHPGHQDLDSDYTLARLFDIAEVLRRINAPDQKREVDAIRDRLRTAAESKAEPTESVGFESTETPEPDPKPAKPSGNLKPWREVIRPSTDVAQGTFQQAEFAADLQQVYEGRADATEYGNPVNFFNQTYITPGIRTLLINALKRIAGAGGDPVIQTKTGFGGGKTHSLIALYHLVNSPNELTNPSREGDSKRTSDEVRSLLQEAGLAPDNGLHAKTAVLVGTYLSPTDHDQTEETGDPLHTLWGRMAYQLGGQQAYEFVGEAARQGIAPGGSQLDRLFQHVGPCVILVDELVAYVRNAGVARDNVYTFIQALTESVRRSENAILVVTLPESEVEAGGEGGAEALARLDHLLGRIEAVWEPLEVNEAFEVVRRRLFGNAIDHEARDSTCESFAAMYSRSRSDYPQGVGEQRYLERMKSCYPIHPEIFDRLYADWSSIPQFQRTRGVLRMLANWISRLYLDQDPAPLILPGSLTLSDPALRSEFTNLLGGQWAAVFTEADSDGSRVDNIDKTVQRFRDIGGAARRIARAVFLGSAPSGALRGIDDRQIHLGVTQPGQGVSVYNEALGRMSGSLYFLYSNDGRHYFHAEENLNRIAVDRAGTLNPQAINSQIVSVLRDEVTQTYGYRSDVIVLDDSVDVPEAEHVRLVILRPDRALPSRSKETDHASQEALRILKYRDGAHRVRRNTLLFLAAREDDIRALRNQVSTYLAWHSIVNGESRIVSLKGERLRQARTSLNRAERDVHSALVRAYRQAMAPVQDDPRDANNYRIAVSQVDGPDTGEIVGNAFDKFIADEALVEKISTSALSQLLLQHVWSSEAYEDHIDIDTLWNLLTSNVYMHRLRNKSVLQTCVEEGVKDGAFGYAESYAGNEYQNLRFGEPIVYQPTLLAERSPGLLVNPVMADLIKQEVQPPPVPDPPPVNGNGPSPKPKPPPPRPPGPTRIVATKILHGEMSLDDIDQLRDEIVRNLSGDGGKVTVEIIIRASKSGGFSESITRSVRENSEQLDVDLKTFDDA